MCVYSVLYWSTDYCIQWLNKCTQGLYLSDCSEVFVLDLSLFPSVSTTLLYMST